MTLAIVARISVYAAELAAVAEVLPLETAEQEARAGLLLRAAQTLHREGEAARKEAKAPHLQAGREVDEAFGGPLGHLDRVSGLLRRRLGEGAERRERERLAALEAVKVAVKAGDHEAANLAILDADPVFQPVAGIAESWTWEVIGVSIGEVPREYLALDLAKVKAEIKACVREGRPPAIAGLVFELRAGLRVASLR